MAHEIDAVVAELGARLNLTEPADDREIAEATAALARSLPVDLEVFLRKGGFAALLDQVAVFSRFAFADVNSQREFHLPSAVFFASDGGDGHFFIDADGSLGRGAGAVFWSDRGVMRPADCVPCGRDLADFFRRVGGEERPWLGDSLRKLGLREMKLALEQHRDRFAAQPGAGQSAILDAGRRVGVRIPTELAALVGLSDCLIIGRGAIAVHELAQVSAVEGVMNERGRPGALWFAADAEANRYAVTIADWRDPDGGKVVRVAPGQSPADAPIIGSLPKVVIGWLAEGRDS